MPFSFLTPFEGSSLLGSTCHFHICYLTIMRLGEVFVFFFLKKKQRILLLVILTSSFL